MKDIKILTDNGIDIKKSLELFGDMNTYDQMLEDFLKEVDGKLANAKKYKDTLDMPNYAIIVHSLKSDCRYFGMDALADLFYEHELAGKRNDRFFVEQNYNQLVMEAQKMIKVLKRYMGILVEDEPQGIPKLASESTTSSNDDVRSILVVDDSNIIRNFIEKIFDHKYKMLSAKDGQEAISIIDNMPHEKLMCVFLDLNMPGVDGFQVLEHFKNINLFDEVPVSIITGSSDKETIDRAFSYPIVDMIQKPFNESKIKDVAEKTILRKKMES